MTPPKLSLVTDTGAQVDCLSRHKLRQLGLTERALLKPQLSLGCANETAADILGVFWVKVSHKSEGTNAVVKVMFHVLKKGCNLLSRTTLIKLELLNPDFPAPPNNVLGGSQQCDQLPTWSVTQDQVVAAAGRHPKQA